MSQLFHRANHFFITFIFRFLIFHFNDSYDSPIVLSLDLSDLLSLFLLLLFHLLLEQSDLLL